MEKYFERMRVLRKEKKETQKQVAAAIGVSITQMQRFERGEQKPGFDNLWKLADHFQVTVDFLMGRSDR